LAGQYENALLLTNDNRARGVAEAAGLNVVDIPAFLLSCKQAGFLDREEIQGVIQALLDKDHYRFRKEVVELLLR
jgi:predicted nucleic acid-binding protein